MSLLGYVVAVDPKRQIGYAISSRFGRDLVDRFAQFCMHENFGERPVWWDGCPYSYYSERMKSITAYRDHLKGML